ncbi:MAG: hypothetical protein ABIA59_09830 [Candidatus Latescibacterota bacterium]
MPETSEKTKKQYCSVCDEHFEMDIVKQGSSESVIWLKCPGCKGFLPFMPDENENGNRMDQDEAGKREIAIEDLDIENSKEYSDKLVFEIGEIVHHRSWNDYGKVVSKDLLPGNRKTIWVQFLRQGKVQLLEGVK